MNWKELGPAFGLGVLVGASGSALIHYLLAQRRTFRDLQQIAAAVRELQREWKEFRRGRDLVDGNGGTRPRSRPRTPAGNNKAGMKRNASDIISLHASSDDDDELDFEEAYEGFTTPPYPLLYKDAPAGFESIESSTEELTAFLAEIDELFKGSQRDQEEALRRMLSKETQYSSREQYIWRLARAKVLVSEVYRTQGDEEERKRLVYEARENAKQAIDLNEELADGHKYYAITQGIMTDWVSFTEAATLGKEYKAHMERAIELRPEEAYLNHLYGRFLFNIVNLGWMQRKAALMMYSLPQSLSLDNALEWFHKAEQLQPGFSNLNPFYTAKCYIAKGDTESAVKYLRNTISVGGKSLEEQDVQREAEELLQQYL